MYFSEETPIGQPISEALGWDDVVFDFSITPNRGDCLSVIGIAREVAALFTEGRLKEEIGKVTYPIVGARNDSVHIAVENPPLCPKFCALYMRNVRVGKSPKWLARRLEAVGIRSISNVVDVTNYIMLDLGQPLHAFDAAKVEDHYIIARLAKDGEEIATLDGKRRVLEDSMLVLADTKKPLDVAGVMGGKESEVTEETKDVILVACVFDPSSIRRTYRHLGLRTEASIRFEKGIDWHLREYALEKTATMIKHVAGGEPVGGIVKVSEQDPEVRIVEVSLEYINSLLGRRFTKDAIKRILSSLSMDALERTKNLFTVTIPSWRHDLSIPADIVEEIGRIYDYNKIVPKPIKAELTPPPLNRIFLYKQKLHAILKALGYQEVFTYSFYGQKERQYMGEGNNKHSEVQNPVSADSKYLRSSLLPLLLETASKNMHFFEDIKIFEIGTIFRDSGELLPYEELNFVGIVSLKDKDVYSIFREFKGDLEAIFQENGIENVAFDKKGEHIDVSLKNQRLGVIRILTEADKELFKMRRDGIAFYFDIASLASVSIEQKKYTPLPKFPSIERDLSFILPRNVSYKNLVKEIFDRSQLIQNARLVDEYYTEARERSLTLRVTYRSLERTLRNEEVEEVESAILRILTQEFGAQLRA